MVSIIIPTYNYGIYIAETIQSVIDQTFQQWECLVIDNGSTDNTREVIEPFLKDKRITYYEQENHGVSHARNTGLNLSKGEFILFLDADDLIEKEKIKKSVELLSDALGKDLVYSDVRYFKSGEKHKLYYSYACNAVYDKPWMKHISGHGLKIVSDFLEGNNFVISGPVFRSSLIKETGFFDESIGHNEDWDFWLRIVLADKRIHYMDSSETRALIRIHKSSASLNLFKMQLCGLKVLVKNSARIKEIGLESKLNERISAHVRLLETTIENSDADQFQFYLSEIRQNPDLSVFLKDISSNRFIFKARLKLKRIFNKA